MTLNIQYYARTNERLNSEERTEKGETSRTHITFLDPETRPVRKKKKKKDNSLGKA